MKNNMSIKKGKKQVYKVGKECDHRFDNMVGNSWNDLCYGHCYICDKTIKVSPLKPKKSKKKKCNHLYDLYGKSNLCVYCRKPKPKKSIKKMYKKGLGLFGMMPTKPVESSQRKELKKLIAGILRKRWTGAQKADALADIFAMQTFKYINLTPITNIEPPII